MRSIPEYTNEATLLGIRREVIAAGFTGPVRFTPEDIAQILHRAAQKSLVQINEAVRDGILADRAETLRLLRHHPGCLISDAQLREIVGVPE